MSVAFVVAIAALLGLVLFLYNEERRPPGPAEWGRTPVWPKRLRLTDDVIILLLGLLAFWGFFVEPNRLVVHEETIVIDNWQRTFDGLRVAVISDIHAGGSFIDDKKLRVIVERTNQLHPELILILGDYMSSNGWTS